MSVFRSVVLSAAIAGLLVGGLITGVQHLGTVPLIQKGEVYEERARQAAHAPVIADHAAPGHVHPVAAWEPADGIERNGFTALANVLAATGFAMILAAAFALLRRRPTWREGLLWGLGGFAAFTLAPGLGLPPELPGVPAAALESRQLWWVATALSTAAGLGLIVFRPAAWGAVLGVLLLAAPHVAGAPVLAEMHSNVPEALSRQFAAAVTVTSLLFWTLLGAVTALVQGRWFSPPA